MDDMENLFEELVGDGAQGESDDSWYADTDYSSDGKPDGETPDSSGKFAALGYVALGVMLIPAVVFICAVFSTCSRLTW